MSIISGGILERMRNVGYRFVGTGAGRIYFALVKTGGLQHLEFKSWEAVDAFCKRKEAEDGND